MLCHCRTKARLLTTFIILVATVGAVKHNPEVMESSSSYSCCDRKIEFDQQCENTFSINNKPIAYSKHGSTECIHPCKKLEGGLLVLDDCAAVNATVVCTNKKNVTVEKRIFYSTQTCSGSPLAPGNQGAVVLWLLALVTCKFIDL